MRMGFSSFNQEMVNPNSDSVSSDSSEVCSVESLEESDLMELEDEATSSFFSPPSGQQPTSPLHDLSSLMHQLPIKRGLSKHFQGKSQSFTSLSNVRSLEDLAKQENPYNKKLKSCKSYGGLLLADQSHTSSSHFPRTNSASRFIQKKASNSRGSCSSLGMKRTPSFSIGSRPPIIPPTPHGCGSTGTSGVSNQTPLFA